MRKADNKKIKEKYFARGQSWDQQIHANIESSKNRAWLISFFCMGISTLSLITLLFLLPLKSFEPYVISVDRQSGYTEVAKGLHESHLSEDKAITQSNLVRYLNARESYNPAILRENYDFVSIMSDGAALKEFQKLWSAQNPENPSIKLGEDAIISIKIKSVSLLNSKTAAIRYLRELQQNDQTHQSHWNAIISFRYVNTPMKMAARFSNPLGFQVTNYSINPEGLENIK